MIIQSEIKSIKKFIPTIIQQSKRCSIDRDILLSIAILENINRPSWLRIWEKYLHLIIRIKTYGLMQVSSKDYIDDYESIELAAEYISKSNYRNDIKALGKLYNGSEEYGICLEFVFNELKDNSEYL